MRAVLAYVAATLILAPAVSLGWRHLMAWRRAKRDIFPPMRTVDVSDEIPF